MSDHAASPRELLPHLFRVEYTKMTAVLCRHFGLQHIETAEDIASETFLKAMESWGEKGIPENPTAWLYTVAKNKAKDYLRRQVVFETQVKDAVRPREQLTFEEPDFTPQMISDSQLAMIFAVCNPSNAPAAQICLALQVLCGCSIAEIAAAFLTKTETIKKRLLRARANLRKDHFQVKQLDPAAIAERLDTVLRTIYLLFNEGYFSVSGDQLIRKDLCSEALRLGLILTENPLTNTTHANALLALMCFQSSRLDARANEAGDTILFEQQDKHLWSQELIDKGNYYLVNACTGDEVSKYHLEAGIAYWHTTPTDQHKWEHILHLYNQLILLEYSPVTALNRTFAFAKVYGTEAGIKEAEKLQLHDNSYYHSLLAYLWATTNSGKAIASYQQAIRLTRSAAEKKTLLNAIQRLQEKR
ncbi:RNA polymerase sigma factor [Chitinophaga polysaccharea]|uniref:RNA polymerase sigma factor n=1 Tax=Chitinophaga polysaccharea TaxID=1293035 RepID=UPI001B3B1FA1|nr:sigma-70 family RNA polymerase sigma factor [Chitinophaga polysaccharea]